MRRVMTANIEASPAASTKHTMGATRSRFSWSESRSENRAWPVEPSGGFATPNIEANCHVDPKAPHLILETNR